MFFLQNGGQLTLASCRVRSTIPEMRWAMEVLKMLAWNDLEQE